MRIHILGICGTFMGGLAMLARSLGHEVTGSDANVYPPMSTLLETQGIELIQGYDASQLDPQPDLVIIGNAMTRGNPCVEAVLENNIPYMSGPQWLHDFVLRDRWVLAVAGIASEEEDEIVVFEGCEHAKYVVLMDPLDGSSNIDVNVSVGTIFSIYRRVTPVGTPVTEEDFLQPGNKQVAAGYVVYGSSTMLVYTTGCGVHAFTYDPSLGVFCLCQERMRFPEKGNTYSINEGNYIKFPQGVKKYIKYCQEEDKATQRPYTSRYIGSLVADFHRNLLKGGIYLYPSTASHPEGKLRLLYECNPMAFLAEQAGGKASDGKERILDIIPESLHQRRSFFVGNNHMVEDVENFIKAFPDA